MYKRYVFKDKSNQMIHLICMGMMEIHIHLKSGTWEKTINKITLDLWCTLFNAKTTTMRVKIETKHFLGELVFSQVLNLYRHIDVW